MRALQKPLILVNLLYYFIFFFLCKTLKTLAVKHLGHISRTKMCFFVLWVQHGVLQDLQ